MIDRGAGHVMCKFNIPDKQSNNVHPNVTNHYNIMLLFKQPFQFIIANWIPRILRLITFMLMTALWHRLLQSTCYNPQLCLFAIPGIILMVHWTTCRGLAVLIGLIPITIEVLGKNPRSEKWWTVRAGGFTVAHFLFLLIMPLWKERCICFEQSVWRQMLRIDYISSYDFQSYWF